VNKYVVSRTIEEPGWQNTTVLRGDLVEEVRALKADPGRDILATGSAQLVHALIATGLVDEYRLFVLPVVVGRAARLFESTELSLHLLETRPFSSGAVLLRFAAGEPSSRDS
jgi:dihydrofolate reductase